MFSYEERKRAVELYLKYDRSASSVIHELGYPSYKTLRDWVDEYEQGGKLHQKVKREPTFTVEQQKKAIAHFFEHGRCISRTVRVLGYPSRPTLSGWIDEIDSDSRKHHTLELFTGKMHTGTKSAGDYRTAFWRILST